MQGNCLFGWGSLSCCIGEVTMLCFSGFNKSLINVFDFLLTSHISKIAKVTVGFCFEI